MCKKGHLGGFRPHPLKIDKSVDEDIECLSQYQIRKGYMKGLKNEKAGKNYLTSPLYFYPPLVYGSQVMAKSTKMCHDTPILIVPHLMFLT